jgi:hypothetical protein
MSAALRAADQQAKDRAQMVGGLGVSIPSSMPAPVDGSDSYVEGSRGSLMQVLGSLTAGAASRRSLAPVLRSDLSRTEARRNSAITKDLASQRKDLVARLPSLREGARAELSQEEVNKRNLRFQQGLARREFNLKAAQTGEQNRQFWAQLGLEQSKFEHAKDVDFQTLAQQQQQLDQAAQEGGGKDAELKAERFNNGVEILTSYMTPSKREEKKGTNIYQSRSPLELYNMLKKRANLPPAEAIRLVRSIQHSGFKDFKPKRARRNAANPARPPGEGANSIRGGPNP